LYKTKTSWRWRSREWQSKSKYCHWLSYWWLHLLWWWVVLPYMAEGAKTALYTRWKQVVQHARRCFTAWLVVCGTVVSSPIASTNVTATLATQDYTIARDACSNASVTAPTSPPRKITVLSSITYLFLVLKINSLAPTIFVSTRIRKSETVYGSCTCSEFII
jgi:hypothetical protein